MTKVAMVAPNFLQHNPVLTGPVSAKKKNEIKKFTAEQHDGNHIIHKSFEDLLISINSAKDYAEIPDKVIVAYKNLIGRNLNFKDTLDTINLTIKIAANKFNEKPKEVLFTGFCFAGFGGINKDSYEKLNAAGWLGCTVSPLIHGIDATKEDLYCHKKDPTYWSPVIIPEVPKKKIITTSKLSTLEITLTFRQEQILQLILKGMTNYQISRRLTLSESTVKMHIGIILKKYAVTNRTQLIFSLKEKIG